MMRKVLMKWGAAAAVLLMLASCGRNACDLQEGGRVSLGKTVSSFRLSGEYCLDSAAVGAVVFHDDGTGSGYTVLLSDGPVDGSIRSGSLLHVRNLYRSMGKEGEWNPFEVAVRGKNISVKIRGIDVVCYTEPEQPFRLDKYAAMRLGSGEVRLEALQGGLRARNLRLERLEDGAVNPADTLPPVDETTDRAIRFQQEDFPVIDWHVHLKGGLTAQQAHAMSMNYGINYGVAPNAGEGGVGRMLADDAEVYAYYDEMKDLPFLYGVQGEGRRWTAQFSREALGTFDYLFTDAMTIVDHKGRLSRIYRDEEVFTDGVTEQQYMDHLTDQTVKILSNEPADFFANAFFLPAFLAGRFDQMWTPERVDRVLDVMQREGIALEISARYDIPGERIVRAAKARGIKFTFGTNNVDADFGRLEYSLDLARKCGLTKEDMWFPSMSTRASRPVVIYNDFSGGTARELFNGKDLSGWVPVTDPADTSGADPAAVFTVKDGLLQISGRPFGYLRTDRQYADYTLFVEWRWVGQGTNSGLFQRVQEGDKVWPCAVECQLMAGRAGDLVSLGGARIAEIPFDPAVKFPVKKRNHPDAALELPDGEWNRAEIICRGNRMTVYINGSLENEATLSATAGYIALQSEGGPLEIRSVRLKL